MNNRWKTIGLAMGMFVSLVGVTSLVVAQETVEVHHGGNSTSFPKVIPEAGATPTDVNTILTVEYGSVVDVLDGMSLGDGGDITNSDTNNVGIFTATPAAKLDVDGGVGVWSTTQLCDASLAGAIKYDIGTNQFEGCTGTAWSRLDCTPDCSGVVCGDDGCGGQCGSCPDQECDIFNGVDGGDGYVITGTNTVEGTAVCEERDYDDVPTSCFGAGQCTSPACDVYSVLSSETAGPCFTITGCSGATPATLNQAVEGAACGPAEVCTAAGECCDVDMGMVSTDPASCGAVKQCDGTWSGGVTCDETCNASGVYQTCEDVLGTVQCVDNPLVDCTYEWNDTTTCSVTCAGGNYRRIANILTPENQCGTCPVVDGELETDAGGFTVYNGGVCNTGACESYYWVATGWGECSNACGTGTETSTAVECHRTSDGAVVSSTFCNAGLLPLTQPCDTFVAHDYLGCIGDDSYWHDCAGSSNDLNEACSFGCEPVSGSCNGCVPETCATLGANCGTPSDTCGDTLSCGSCSAIDCDGSDTPCRDYHDITQTCTDGACVGTCTSYTNMPIGTAVTGGYCDGNGAIVTCTADAQCSDGNDCTEDICNNPGTGTASCSNPYTTAGTDCGAGYVCDGAGNCSECIVDTDCAANETCVAQQCMASCPAQTILGCELGLTAHGGSDSGCAATYPNGDCNYTCNDGEWVEVNNTCEGYYGCDAEITMACDLMAAPHGATDGGCIAGFSGGDCEYTCNNGAWVPNYTSTCAPLDCDPMTDGGCVLPATQNGYGVGPISCTTGWVGLCTYGCSDGNWTQTFNNCCHAAANCAGKECGDDGCGGGGTCGTCAPGETCSAAGLCLPCPDTCENKGYCGTVSLCGVTTDCGGCTGGDNCVLNTCETPACTADVDCDDVNTCTTDTCANPGLANAVCEHTNNPVDGGWSAWQWQCTVQPWHKQVRTCTNPAPSCGGANCSGLLDQNLSECVSPTPRCNISTGDCVECTNNMDCDDGNECTVDTCTGSNTCSHTNASAGTVCKTDNMCDGSGNCVACLDGGDCNDGLACTNDVCTKGVCSNEPILLFAPDCDTSGISTSAGSGYTLYAGELYNFDACGNITATAQDCSSACMRSTASVDWDKECVSVSWQVMSLCSDGVTPETSCCTVARDDDGAGMCLTTTTPCTDAGLPNPVTGPCSTADCTATTINNCVLPAGTVGVTTSGTCGSGTTGRCSYTCTSTKLGYSWVLDSNTCTALGGGASCPASVFAYCDRAATPDGGTSGTCSGGYIGSCSYTCNDGTFGAPSSNTCTTLVGGGASCLASTYANCERSATPDGGTSGTCSSGYTGSCSYTCNNGTWGTPSSNTCSACTPVDGGWSAWGAWECNDGGEGKTAWVDALKAQLVAYSGAYDRARYRTCTNPAPSCGGATCVGSNIEEDDCSVGTSCVAGVCEPNACAATTVGNCTLSGTASGQTSGQCVSGYSGTCSALCTNGSWGSVTDNCLASCDTAEIANCHVAGVASGQTSGECISGFLGTCSTLCTDGSWGLLTNDCTQPPCDTTAIDNCYLAGVASGQTSGTCESGYSGTCQYTCNLGTWSMQSNTCCLPNCTGKTCGSDGCGGSCGTCAANQPCINNNCGCGVDVDCPAMGDCPGWCLGSGECSACFVGSEEVLTSDGPVPIQDIQVGDEVISYDEEVNTFTTSVVGEIVIHDGVHENMNNYSKDNLLEVTVAVGNTETRTKVTDNHLYFSPSEQLYKPIGMFEIGESVLSYEGTGVIKSKKVLIDGRSPAEDQQTIVYNLHMSSGPHNYLVDKILVHNYKPACGSCGLCCHDDGGGNCVRTYAGSCAGVSGGCQQ